MTARQRQAGDPIVRISINSLLAIRDDSEETRFWEASDPGRSELLGE